MGIWAKLEGRIAVPKSSHFSVKKYFKESLSGQDYNLGIITSYSLGEFYVEYINLSIEYDKDQLDKFLKKIDLDFKENNIKCDIGISTRYIVN